MDPLFEHVGRWLAGAYAIYLGLLGVLGMAGVHLGLLVVLLFRRSRGAVAVRLVLDFLYGFINPLIYLVIFAPFSAFRSPHPFDRWLVASAWVLFAAIWSARFILPRRVETSPLERARLARLCFLALICLVAFGLNDLLFAWMPKFFESRGRGSLLGAVWVLAALAPLYLIPVTLVYDYRMRLARGSGNSGFLLTERVPVIPLAAVACVLVVVTLIASVYQPSAAATRARVDQLRPAITEAALSYDVDPELLSAIIYVTQRDQIAPFRDHLERMAASVFLKDDKSHLMLAKPFDVSIGIAQVKPITALTALWLCRSAGWQVWSKHLRDIPRLGREWELTRVAQDVCRPPSLPLPVNKPQVVSALLRDESNVAFAALILALYQAQWREANPAWDISKRPEILATLYQIGFAKSHPHAAPRSNAFGDRVSEMYGELRRENYAVASTQTTLRR